jgi:small subunit ribosomal protein S8
VRDMPARAVIPNVFSSLNNASIRRHRECLIYPVSRLALDVLRLLQRHGYIGEIEYIDDGRGGKARVQLLGRINACGAITPRFPVKKDAYEKWEKQFLPAVNTGFLIVSTPKGVMTHFEAREKGVGGVLLGYVY